LEWENEARKEEEEAFAVLIRRGLIIFKKTFSSRFLRRLSVALRKGTNTCTSKVFSHAKLCNDSH
jgi:hypothetical protein